ncbi:MAG: ABC transporter ATP-binding protein [Vicinamibacterales bacterium]
MLQADNVSFTWRRRRQRLEGEAPPGIHAVSLTIEDGSRVALLGPNGSGKTTLLRLLAGTLVPDSGRVMLDGMDLRQMERTLVARRIATVPQATHLAFEYTVLEIALMGRYPHLRAFQIEGPADLLIARSALEATGTASFEDRLFSTLSGGEKQRVVIASALAQSAAIMLLDEPTASLDLGYQLEVASVLRRLNAERGLTVVVATHDLNFAASLSDTLVLLRDGRLLAAGRTADVLDRAAVRMLYDVDADVSFHDGAGHLTVVPLERIGHPGQAGGGGRHA